MSFIMKTIGLCMGASTVSVAQVGLSGKGLEPQVIGHSLHPHGGDPRNALLSELNRIDLDSFDRIAVTGRRFRKMLRLSSISEPEAVESAYRFLKPGGIRCPAVISAGGETFMVYVMSKEGIIVNVLTGNKCASGTGEFFLQQLTRMGVTLQEAARWAAEKEPYQVSGRCSVFCKSDCTHATNKGVPKSRVTAGLCRMMADKVLGLLTKVEKRNIMLTGGTARNRMMVDYLGQEIPGLIVPKEAPYFEALGAALWALDNETAAFPRGSRLFSTKTVSQDLLPPLSDFSPLVEFKTMETGEITPGDNCILGLDVGSTTTKAILLRRSDNALLASVYLRTNGDPVGAARQCYVSILDQVGERIDPADFSVIGLGVCGSGRQIAGFHAFTEGIINEIIAHATAAVFFDRQVDTIFEIGGQDAKYIHITNGVPSDYAMNEACSAGTGSFLEESALESLGIRMEDIAEIAIRGESPPNFNDQCAAFIASDIKNAIHRGVKHDDIVAGLVYSICMNYANRVKGNRAVGKKVFMQGGVCYNQAIPLAMASLVGKPIIVPPEPGLMGAFGVALAVKARIESGQLPEKSFDLAKLSKREVKFRNPFTCTGGKERCDRRCEINVIEIEKKRYPFGGACNRFYNIRSRMRYDVSRLNLVRVRQHLVFEKYGAAPKSRIKGRIGINRTFLVNTYWPLYSTFFSELGYEPVLAGSPERKGIDRKNAPLCYPGELAHGFFHSLLSSEEPLDFIFLPHFKSVPAQNGTHESQVCPIVQGETFYLQVAFKKEINRLKEGGTKLLSPLLDLSKGLENAATPLVETAVKMGAKRKEAENAFIKALGMQTSCFDEMKEIGKLALSRLKSTREKFAVVLFARPYNGFAGEAHMGIPNKFASRGVMVIPHDFLTFEKEESGENMYWGMGQMILMAARVVERDPQLFGTYITNFSCGPDSFITGYFRNLMGKKPSLTLELDSHTADAGLETRIEAFLDIVTAYRQLVKTDNKYPAANSFTPAQTILETTSFKVVTSKGERLPLTAPEVTLLIPSMGRYTSEALAAVWRSIGINAKAHQPADETILKIGRGNTTCKECLPLILTTGTLLHYIENERKRGEILVYFMPTSSGPCRFGQYHIFMKDLIKKLEIEDVALFSLTSENAYAGIDARTHLRMWWAVITADLLEDIRSMILANAVNPGAAAEIFHGEWKKVLATLEQEDFSVLEKRLCATAEKFRELPMKKPPAEVPAITITGEIFVRHDPLSRQYLTEKLAERGFAALCSPVAEWIHYSDYLLEKGLCSELLSIRGRVSHLVKRWYMVRYEKRIKSIIARSGLIHPEKVDIRSLIECAAPYISMNLAGEAVLTVGSALEEVACRTCGVIAIGPFGCMPNRISEAILSETMNSRARLARAPSDRKLRKTLSSLSDLPFLSIESDGSPFPQLINAKLDAFCLGAKRLHKRMLIP